MEFWFESSEEKSMRPSHPKLNKAFPFATSCINLVFKMQGHLHHLEEAGNSCFG